MKTPFTPPTSPASGRLVAGYLAFAGALALGSTSPVWAQAGGLRTSFEFTVSPLSSMALRTEPETSWLRRASRFDLVDAWRSAASGGGFALGRASLGLSTLQMAEAPLAFWQRAEMVNSVGPLSVAGFGVRPLASDALSSPFSFDPVRYRLESSRVTLRAPVYEDESWTLRLGATGVNSTAGFAAQASRVGLGLVPMWHASAERRFTERWSLVGDLNIGLSSAALTGQPIDMSLRAAYEWDRDWSVTGGYRLVDSRNASVPGLTGVGGVSRVQSLTLGLQRSF